DGLSGEPDARFLLDGSCGAIARGRRLLEVDTVGGTHRQAQQRFDDLLPGVARQGPNSELDGDRVIEQFGELIGVDLLAGEGLGDLDRLTFDRLELLIAERDQRRGELPIERRFGREQQVELGRGGRSTWGEIGTLFPYG